MRWLAGLLLAVFLGMAPAIVFAATPAEMLADPRLEARAEALGDQLRCLVCQGESIEASNADLAHDLRVLVRERIKAGDTDQQVIDYLVSRYGEFVLLKPVFAPYTWLLWLAGPGLLVIGGIAIILFLRMRRHQPAEPARLGPDEKAALLAFEKEEMVPTGETRRP